MNNYDITILYAHHNQDTEPSAFPHQTIDPCRLEIIPILEDDLFAPRRNSLAAISRASGRYTIMLDDEDAFDSDFLERLLDAAENPQTLPPEPEKEEENPESNSESDTESSSEDSFTRHRHTASAESATSKVYTEVSFLMPSLSCQFVTRGSEHFKRAEDFILDVYEKASIFPAGLHGLLIDTARLQKASRNLTLTAEPEKQILLRLFADNSVFGFLGTCTLQYAFPKEIDTAYDMRCHSREWYFDSLQQFLLPALQEEQRTRGKVTPLLQCMALYMINIRLSSNSDNKNKHVLNLDEVPGYVDLLCDLMQFIDTEIILTSYKTVKPIYTSRQRRLFYIRMKKRDFSYHPDVECEKEDLAFTCDGQLFGTLSSLPLRIHLIEYRKGNLEIDGSYFDYLSESAAKVHARFDRKDYPLEYNQRYSMTKYFGVTAFRMKTFHVSIPVPPPDHEMTLQFILTVGSHEYPMTYAFPTQFSRFSKDFGYVYWRFDQYLAFWRKTEIHVIKSGKFKVLKKEVGLWLQMIKKKNGYYLDQLPVKIINFLLRPYFSRQKIWLFMDKIYKGADSSEYLYRYAVKQDDEIKKYYLLDKHSADYKRMRKEGYRPLIRGSLKHRLVFLNSSMIIASNSTVWAFNDYGARRSFPIRGDVHFDVACVQHGMSVQKIAIAQQRLRDNTRLYFCASKYEIENLSKPVYDYEGTDALKLTGVPRYDGLISRPEKIIVLSPTWRMQSALPVTKNEGVARDYNPNFKESEYYQVYNGLINDPRLLDAARKYGYRIQYVLHPIISPQSEDFDKNDVVEIIPSIGDMSYEKIFCEGALMVTDFSGVQFDFAYMRKPVVYLHHNDIPQHYEEGTFHYKTMGFGEICHTNEELIDVLTEYMEHDCVMPELYRKRADDFFYYSDNSNCERIYPIMLEYERNKR